MAKMDYFHHFLFEGTPKLINVKKIVRLDEKDPKRDQDAEAIMLSPPRKIIPDPFFFLLPVMTS